MSDDPLSITEIVPTFIAQLRNNAPVFGGRVAGAAEFYAGLKNYNTSLPLPAAYVLPLPQEADANQVWTGLIQIVHINIGIAVEFDAQRDRRGQSPTMDMLAIQEQIFNSVLNLRLDPVCRMSRGTAYSGARQLDLDRARLWWQWEFVLDWQISDADGVQPDSWPLTSIELDGFHAPGAVGAPGDDPAFVFVVDTEESGTPPPPTDGPWPP